MKYFGAINDRWCQASHYNSVAILVSEILDLVSPKDFGMTQYLILFSISLSIQENQVYFLVYGALVNLVSEKHNFSSWLRRELATLLLGAFCTYPNYFWSSQKGKDKCTLEYCLNIKHSCRTMLRNTSLDLLVLATWQTYYSIFVL